MNSLPHADTAISPGFPAGSDVQPVLYSEEKRELEDLVAFIDTAATPRDEL